MKAVVYEKYGGPEVLQLKEVEKPVPKENEVLIKVHTASVNSWDWDLVRGTPYLIRLEAPFQPKHKILGCDIAGRVEAVGNKVKEIQVGDEVFGDISRGNWGGFAEYVCADETYLAIKPKEMSFADAAAIPQAGVLALQALRDMGHIQSGQKILINGASGGVGTFGLQIAKLHDVEITCVDKEEKLEMLKSLGADHVIDYTKKNYTTSAKAYDLIIDNVTSQPLKNYIGALRPGGKYVVVGGKISTIFKIGLFGKLYSKIYGKHLRLLIHKTNKDDLDYLSILYVEGKLRPIIGDEYSLEETALAISKLKSGDVLGKAVILMQ